MPRRRASSKSGRVSGPGISRSKNASISVWSSIHQRGKKVVRASSGNTTRSQPCAFACCKRSRRRFTTCGRASARWIGPSCAAPTVTTLLMVRSSSLSLGESRGEGGGVRSMDHPSPYPLPSKGRGIPRLVGADAACAQAIVHRAVGHAGLHVVGSRRSDSRAWRGVEPFHPQHAFEGGQAEQHVLSTRGVAHGADAPDLALELTEGGADLDAELLDESPTHGQLVHSGG